MALVALASIKGAPGVTTSAIALASVWPAGRPAIVVELDQAGGDVAARWRLPAEPSAVSLAAAVRRTHGGGQFRLLDHCQVLPGGLQIVAGTPAPAEMRAAIDAVADALPTLAATGTVDVLVDCGRLDPAALLGSVDASDPALALPVRRMLSRADLLLVVSRGELADLSHVQAWLPSLRTLNESVVLLLVGRLSWRAAEISAALGADVLSHLPHDTAGADMVGGRPERGGIGRMPLLRAARHAADQIVKRLPESVRPSAEMATSTVADVRRLAAAGEGEL
jgi:hypothetical protein